MDRLYNDKGVAITLGARLGVGGEGSVYNTSEPGLVAKVYHERVSQARAAKIAAMVRLKSDRLLRLTAWPVTALRAQPQGEVRGFLTVKIEGAKEAHSLYSPKSRRTEFPEANWPFLMRAAANIARAVAVVHEHGHVIGDINHGNVLVSPQATAVFIDCDSFQVTDKGTRYLCEVGVSTYTPPELQGKSFATTIRSPNHDCFGLAVLIFHLLFMGRHPFAGRHRGSAYIAIEEAIEHSLFTFGRRAASQRMAPPPDSLALDAVSPPVAALFERAFAREGLNPAARPAAREWVEALGLLEKQLVRCAHSSSHHYLRTLRGCPWCKIEGNTGVVLFGFAVRTLEPATGTGSMTALWASILAVASPGPAPALPGAAGLGPSQPSAEARRRGLHRRARAWTSITVVVAAVVAVVALSVPGGLAFWIPAGTCWAAWAFATANTKEARREAEQRLRAAQVRWQDLERRWCEEAGESRFVAKRGELDSLKQEYDQLSALRERRLRQLEADRRGNQLRRFLERHFIRSAHITDIGPGRTATLASYGVETAADVSVHSVSRVPGFGPYLTSRLTAWRRRVEARFVFNPNEAVDPQDKARVEQEIADRRMQIRRELERAPRELSSIRDRALATRKTLAAPLAQALREKLQAEADLKAL